VILRRAVVGTVFVVSASLLTGCGLEAPAVEDTESPSVQAADFHVGAIEIDDTAITSTTTNGVPHFWLQATFVNNGSAADTLSGATTSQGTLSISGGTGTAGGLTIPPGVPVEVVAPAPGSTAPSISAAISPSPTVGGFVPIVFTFTDAGTSPTIQVPVIPVGETTAATQAVPTATASVPTESGQSADD
jgi:hypothetical protein